MLTFQCCFQQHLRVLVKRLDLVVFSRAFHPGRTNLDLRAATTINRKILQIFRIAVGYIYNCLTGRKILYRHPQDNLNDDNNGKIPCIQTGCSHSVFTRI